MLGILGGTFDPIHLGHIHLALSCYYALQLNKVRLIPCANPLLREPPLASPEQRLTMVQLAISNHPQLEVDDVEIKRQGPSYALTTLQELRKQFPNQSLCYIIGADQFAQFHRWHCWEEIPELAHVIVTSRAGYKMRWEKPLRKMLKQRQLKDRTELSQQTAGGILLQPIVPLSLSATEIRQKILLGEEPQIYLPQGVADYIRKENLYVSIHQN